jgi:arsenate reductase
VSKTRVLFLCTQNSARSQMAEALLRKHGGDRFEAYSAGVSAAEEIHPYTIQVMEEIGVDMSGHRAKGLREYMGKMHFGYLIIVCARAEENCPTVFPGVGIRFSWLFEDPRRFEGTEEEKLEKFREVRDKIEERILNWLEHPEEEIADLKALRDLERHERQQTR